MERVSPAAADGWATGRSARCRRLPRLEDAEVRAVLDVLAAVLPPAFFSDENLVCLVLCRMAICSLAHGNGDASPLGYAYLGMMLGPYFGDWRAGFEFGLLGQALVEEGGLAHYAARVQMCFAYHVAPWTRHISFTLPRLRRAFEIAVRAGDLTYSGFSACTLVTSLLAAGAPLAEVEGVAVEKLDFVRRARFGLDRRYHHQPALPDARPARLPAGSCQRGRGRQLGTKAKFEARLAAGAKPRHRGLLALDPQAAGGGDPRGLCRGAGSPRHGRSRCSGPASATWRWRSITSTPASPMPPAAAARMMPAIARPSPATASSSASGPRIARRISPPARPLLEGAVAAIEGRGFTAMQHFEAAIRSAAENRPRAGRGAGA